MVEKEKIELFYGLVCPHCKTLKKMLKNFLTKENKNYVLKETLISSPIGMIKSFKKNIHSVPTLLLNDKVIFRYLPTEEEFIKKIKKI